MKDILAYATVAFIMFLILLFTISGFTSFGLLTACSKEHNVHQCELVAVPKEVVDE
tara:strand:+ start:297 stop:464 length:168 start_codon:yes stop_codon:yes gene_type:complete